MCAEVRSKSDAGRDSRHRCMQSLAEVRKEEHDVGVPLQVMRKGAFLQVRGTHAADIGVEPGSVRIKGVCKQKQAGPDLSPSQP